MLCEHYTHWVQPIHPIERKPVNCRLCACEHYSSEFNRRQVRKMKCSFCCCVQNVHKSCQNPQCTQHKKLHHYYCAKCRLWEHNTKKDIFHCDGCGICRLGKREHYEHCTKCMMCVPKRHPHFCVGGHAKDNPCPVCYEDVSQCPEATVFLKCGHAIHMNCQLEWLKRGGWAALTHPCPICKT